MSKRQMSFFDQDPKVGEHHPSTYSRCSQRGAQAAPYRQRSRRLHDAPGEVVPYNKPTMAFPPIAVSSQSKAKLKAFQFAEDKTSHSSNGDPQRIVEADKENMGALKDPLKLSASQSKPRSQNSSQTFALQARGECPQTPVGRLPLAELIGNTEDVLAHGESDTPYERVYWNVSPRTSDEANSLETPAARRGKKRARSSSPSSSPNEASNHFTVTKPSFDLQTLQKSFKTPQADPAGDLWSRYSMNGNDKQTPTGPGALRPIELLHSSSPQTPVMHLLGRDGGLRRTMSCGTEWPTSIAKRRKIQHTSSHKEINTMLAAEEEAGDGRSTTKMSRVSLLVDMVQERLAKPVDKLDVRGPSSSSPLPDTGSFDDNRASPSLQRLQAQTVEQDSSPTGKTTPRKHTISRQQSPEVQNQKTDDKDSSSDFGDDDLDFELLDAVDARIASTDRMGREVGGTAFSELFLDDGGSSEQVFVRRMSPMPPSEIYGCANNERPAPRGTLKPGILGSVHCLPEQALGQTTEQPSMVQTGEETDEFGDDNSDLFAADLEDVVAMYDSLQPENDQAPTEDMAEDETDILPTATKVAASPHTDVRTTEPVEVSSDDEFGENLDFEQIAVEYASAAQGFQSTASRNNPVRTTHL